MMMMMMMMMMIDRFISPEKYKLFEARIVSDFVTTNKAARFCSRPGVNTLLCNIFIEREIESSSMVHIDKKTK
jgi:hypothetical protein